MLFVLLGALTGVIGCLPLLFLKGKKNKWFYPIVAIAVAVLVGLLYYASIPSLVWPLGGVVGVIILMLLIGTGILPLVMFGSKNFLSIIPAGVAVLIFFGTSFSGCNVLRANDYANLIGDVQKKEWTRDVQPQDPKHIRLVPRELAIWLANKQLGEAPGAIGSQFQISTDHMTLQMINGELWYVAPLDYKDFGVWTSTNGAPGYVMIHGEDPNHPVIVKFQEKFVYMPGAYFGKNLERYLWTNGYAALGLTDYSFEIDESGKAWWVVTVFKPTISWWGEKATGVVIIDPTNGSNAFYSINEVPKWVDRAIPAEFVKEYVSYKGHFSNGWWNSFWSHQNMTEPEDINLVYGSDGQPYWVTNITSINENDEALVGLYYLNSKTGKATFYHAIGGTNHAVVTAVNNKVAYKQLHGESPVLYNIYGTMAAIVPLLGVNHTFQGTAIVNIKTLQVAIGENQYVALREYQKELALSGQQITPELARNRQTINGTVDRFASEVKTTTGTIYYLHINGVPHLFTGASELSPKLPLTKVGDQVEITYIASGEDVMPMLSFKNISLPLKSLSNQK